MNNKESHVLGKFELLSSKLNQAKNTQNFYNTYFKFIENNEKTIAEGLEEEGFTEGRLMSRLATTLIEKSESANEALAEVAEQRVLRVSGGAGRAAHIALYKACMIQAAKNEHTVVGWQVNADDCRMKRREEQKILGRSLGTGEEIVPLQIALENAQDVFDDALSRKESSIVKKEALSYA